MSNNVEREVIYLLAVVDLIRSMVNRAMFDVGEGDDTNIFFRTSAHHSLFAIALVDFLSMTDAAKEAPVPATPYLRALRTITARPSFNVNGSVADLESVADSFKSWLDEKIEVDVWLPTIGKQLLLRPTRRALHCIAGNLTKHNFLRSIGVAKELQHLLASAGAPLEMRDVIQAQGDIYEHFHDNVGLYHSSAIAEFLNNLLWGIQTYLQPEFERSWTQDRHESCSYSYRYPAGLTDPLARACYWELMNRVRSGPIFQPFTISSSFKSRY
ncbi:hypothetical protein [Pseudomonas sp. JG-B]|uniref:hypothetical protein n=1 Tax=Pseudomonas sp. JG-B TaxID=2603214 RepID=UPI00129D4970|nr:hypothetical protein [Pseudomonas sp. JG-B]MRK21953.1 hypothetical protein [Pseudomonas sp. JG-B]